MLGKPISDKEGELLYYLVGSYKYDVLNDVLNSINISANGEAFIVNTDGLVMGHRDKELIRSQVDLAVFLIDNFAALSVFVLLWF